jgi:hypothetical protein
MTAAPAIPDETRASRREGRAGGLAHRGIATGLTIGRSPAGHGRPSCPTSRCFRTICRLARFTRFSSASSKNEISLALRICLILRIARTASRFNNCSSSHMFLHFRRARFYVRGKLSQRYFRTCLWTCGGNRLRVRTQLSSKPSPHLYAPISQFQWLE